MAALSPRDARTEAIVERSKELQRQLREMSAILDRFVHDLQAEVERLHDTEVPDE